jgi:hypothetical protein
MVAATGGRAWCRCLASSVGHRPEGAGGHGAAGPRRPAAPTPKRLLVLTIGSNADVPEERYRPFEVAYPSTGCATYLAIFRRSLIAVYRIAVTEPLYARPVIL